MKLTRQEAIERCARKGFEAAVGTKLLPEEQWQARSLKHRQLWIHEAERVICGDLLVPSDRIFNEAVIAESKIPEVAAALAQGDAPAPVEAEPWPYDDAIRRMAAEVARWAISNATRTSRNSEADLTEQLGRVAECFARLSMIGGVK